MQDLFAEISRSKKDSHSRLRPQEFWALKDINFQLERGQCLGIMGPNGSGKSTLLKLISGLIKPDTGFIRTRGKVGALLSLSSFLDPHLTGRENIFFTCSMMGFSKKQTIKAMDSIWDFSELGNQIYDTPIQHYSSGMRLRLAFSCAIEMQPDILLLDEVFAVGDMGFYIKCLNALSKKLRHSAVILVSHNSNQIRQYANSCLVLDRGRENYTGPDVVEAIGRYYDVCSQKEAFLVESGNAHVTDLYLSGVDTKTLKETSYLSPLTLNIKLHLASEIHDYVLQIVFTTRSLKDVAMCDSQMSQTKLTHDGSGSAQLSLTIPSLALNPDHYWIGVAIRSPDGLEVLYYKRTILPFCVQGAISSYPLIQLDAIWEDHSMPANRPLK